MENENPKSENQKKPKARLLAKVALYCGLGSLIIAVTKSLTFLVVSRGNVLL